ncbi:hypothetical protein, partial [Vibrio harveyi]|uniref:hypothetical protein n=1 Tax=Vibrio harveyi TaxID=669 RepID=UPI000AF9A7E2
AVGYFFVYSFSNFFDLPSRAQQSTLLNNFTIDYTRKSHDIIYYKYPLNPNHQVKLTKEQAYKSPFD